MNILHDEQVVLSYFTFWLVRCNSLMNSSCWVEVLPLSTSVVKYYAIDTLRGYVSRERNVSIYISRLVPLQREHRRLNRLQLICLL